VLVDPVMADNGKLYPVYTSEMAQGMSKLCGHADIIAPNLTEAAFLLDEPYVDNEYDKGFIEGLLERLTKLGPKQVVLTGVSFEPGQLGAACLDKNTGSFGYYGLAQIEGYFHGTGDVFGSALLSGLLHGAGLSKAMEIAVKYTHRCITLTVEAEQERRYGVCFERAIPYLINLLDQK
jgi:pyridoxine kinase